MLRSPIRGPDEMTQSIPVSDLQLEPASQRKAVSQRALRVLCHLGQGGMAEVHLASVDAADGESRLVVVKRMHSQHLHDPATVRMFLDEARLALRLAHPNIVRTERLAMFDGRHGIVMEYLEGQPFHQLLKRAYERDGTLSLELIAQVAIAALDGLHYAHELKDALGRPLNIVHRDVSPQNLFVTYDGAVKLLDFGIAKNALQDGRTRTGLLKGKVSYMAPEQARGEEIDRRADLWSLGVVLWEAVTASRLFRGANEAATLNMTLSEEIPQPSLRRPDVPPELEAVLMRALARDPAARYQTAAAMRDDLETWLCGRELLPSASVSQLMPRLFANEMRQQRERIQALRQAQPPAFAESGVTLVAASSTGVSSSGLRATQISTVTDLLEELTRQRRFTTRAVAGIALLLVLAVPVGLYLALRPPAVVGPSYGAPTTLVAPAALAPTPTSSPPRAAEPTTEPTTESSAVTSRPIAADASPKRDRAAGPRRTARAQRRDPRALVKEAEAEVEVEEEAATGPTRSEPAVASEGLLSFDTTPWSIVSLGGRVLGQTPLVGVRLPAGTHTLSLSNPELGSKTSYQVTIRAGQTTARRIGLD